jgi:glucokinase
MRTPRAAAAVDLGQTKLLSGLVDRSGSVSDATERPTPLACREHVLTALDEEIERLLSAGAEVIGVSSATLVEHPSQRLLWPGVLPLEGFRLRDWLEERFHRPVAVENDANCAAVAEHRAGVGKGYETVIVITVGTGVGAGLILGGRLFRGANGVAGEVGHMILDPEGPECLGGCPGRGHLEVFASGTALDRCIAQEAAKRPDGAIGRGVAAGRAPVGRLAVELAEASDTDARRLIEELGEWLGYGLITLVNLLNPDVIAIGGGVSRAGELLLAPARRVLAQAGLEPARSTVQVLSATFGSSAGLVGAGLLALDAAR